jgi:hypothetical protein
MQVRDGGPRQLHSYTCKRLAPNYGGDSCPSLPGASVEAFVRQWVLTAEEYERFVQAQPRLLAAAERAAIVQLAPNIPSRWQAPTTTLAERKEMVRQISHRVTVAGEGTSERLQVTSEWVGGSTTGIVTRPFSRIEHLSYSPLLGERIQTLAPAGDSTAQIMAALAQEWFHSPKQGPPFSRQSVHELMRRLGVHQPWSRRRLPLSEQEWWFAD